MTWPIPQTPIVVPIAIGETQGSGRTRPIKMICRNGDEVQDYVVKLKANVELKEHSLARELYGSLLAEYFNLETPSPALVQITSQLPLIESDPFTRQSLQASIGLNFGSQYIKGPLIFSPPARPGLISKACRVFCFDMLIGNVDRRDPRINLFQSPEGFILYDHEQAFPFSRPLTMLGGAPNPWDFIHEVWVRQHILYSSVKSKDCSLDIEDFIQTLLSLTDDVFATIEEQIPDEWKTEEIAHISHYISKARDNATLFKRSLQETLV